MTETDAILLDAVQEHLNRPRDGRLESAMAARTGLSAGRAWQRVNALLADPEAVAAYPLTIATLRRRRERGRRAS